MAGQYQTQASRLFELRRQEGLDRKEQRQWSVHLLIPYSCSVAAVATRMELEECLVTRHNKSSSRLLYARVKSLILSSRSRKGWTDGGF